MIVRHVWPLALVALVGSAGLSGCDTTESPVSEAEPTPLATDFDPEVPPGPVALRKLTRSQYQNSLKDLFGADVAIPRPAEPDAVHAGLAAVGASTTTYSPRGVESFEQIAFAVAAEVMATPSARQAVLPCEPAGIDDGTCARAALAPLARRAFRRAVTDTEVDALVAVTLEAAAALGTFDAGLEFGIAAILQSPSFLYRAEVGHEAADGRVFDDYELATRLSYFLWNTTPDDTLLAAAAAGELSTDAGLAEQAMRLLEAPRARLGLRRFFIEWLQLGELESLNKDPTVYEFYNNALGPSAMEETLHLLEWMVFEDARDIRTLLTTTTTFVNPLLAALYGVPMPGDPEAAQSSAVDGGFVQIRLPEDGPRAGLLGHASFLNGHAHATSTSVTLRGKAVRNLLLCQTMPSPPVNVDTSIPEPSGDAPTMRERVAIHLEEESCAGCHIYMDPIGLGLENFDGSGRFRHLDNGALIDASGDLDGAEFDGPRTLGIAVASDPAFTACVTRTLVRYAIGRTETAEERRHLATLTARFEAHGYRLLPLILEVIQSPLFRQAGPGAEQ